MNTEKLKDFLFGMKRANKRQIKNNLYAIDAKTDEVCGCALGQALLEANVITEEEIRTKTKKISPFNLENVDGTSFKGYIPDSSVDAKAYAWLNENFGKHFAAEVYIKNDEKRMSLGDIAMAVYNKYFPG
jgi:hypothetical protein